MATFENGMLSDNEQRRRALMNSLGQLSSDEGPPNTQPAGAADVPDVIGQRSDNTGINGGNIPAGGEPGGFAGPAAGGTPAGPKPSSFNAAYDPRLVALAQKYNKTDTGAGSGLNPGGFDMAYWDKKIPGDADYFLNRLESDLQMKGPDEGGGGMPTDQYWATHSAGPGMSAESGGGGGGGGPVDLTSGLPLPKALVGDPISIMNQLLGSKQPNFDALLRQLGAL